MCLKTTIKTLRKPLLRKQTTLRNLSDEFALKIKDSVLLYDVVNTNYFVKYTQFFLIVLALNEKKSIYCNPPLNTPRLATRYFMPWPSSYIICSNEY